jgi:hypothetical protein
MNTSTANLISNIEGLLSSQLKMAEAHGLPTLPGITTARARTILLEIQAAKKASKATMKEPKYFNRLDKIHA